MFPIILCSLLFLVAIAALPCIIAAPFRKIKDNRTESQKILDCFEIKENGCDLNEFISFCRENPSKYSINANRSNKCQEQRFSSGNHRTI